MDIYITPENPLIQYLKTPAGDNSPKAKLIYMFENKSPYEFLRMKNGNVEPTARELKLLENLLIAAHTQYHSTLFSQFLHLPILKKEELAIRQKALEVLDFLGLSLYKDYLAWGLPYGILKKIEIARTLMNNPQLIILDEPAAGLNDSETAELTKLIRKIQEKYKCTILLVEHDMGLVMDICDTVCAISFGKLLAIGNTEEIQANKEVQAAYLGYSEEE